MPEARGGDGARHDVHGGGVGAAFRADVLVEMVPSLRLAASLGVFVVPMFYVLDRIAVPAEASMFLGWRLLASAALAVVVAMTWTVVGRRAVLALGYLALLSAALPVSAMVAWIDPGVSPYYAGLDLAMLFNGVLFPWHPVHTAAVNGVLIASFLLPVGTHGGPSDPAAFTNNTFFVVVTAAVSTISSWSLYRERRRRFELAWSLEMRSADLIVANERLREVDEAKSRFFANVSHELRTPLTLALSPLAALLATPDLPAALRPTLEALQLDMLALARRIEDLVDLARLDSGRRPVRNQGLDLAMVVRQVVAAAQPFAERQAVALTVEHDPKAPVTGDPGVLEQVVFNLLTNALKFTPRGGVVHVSLRADPTDVTLRVADTGPGIPLDEQADLFTRFGHTTSSGAARGSGLGLALVKEHVEQHGGTVRLESAPGQGSVFVVRLPRAEGAVEAANTLRTGQLALDFEAELSQRDAGGPVAEVPPPDGRPLVMVVEDNVRLRQFVATSLADEYRVAEATDGAHALSLLAREAPLCVVSDMMMPEVDGRGLVAAIRADPELRHLPVLLLTAHGDAEVRDETLELGASDFLTKPFSVRELRARVRNFVALRSAQTSLAAANVSLARALDELRVAQVRALRTEKLAAVGQLAGSIAHEVKNPVNFLLNFARPSRGRVRRLAEGAPDDVARELAAVEDALDRVVEGGERIVHIVNGLQSFARGGHARVAVDVDAEVRAAVRMVEGERPAALQVDLALAADGTVLGSPVGVGAVVRNLVSNAAQASTAPARVWVRTWSDAQTVTVEVRDEGSGIAPEHRDRLWDPFFTTRGAGEGLGLGLALVHRIVYDDMGGEIQLDTEPGRGTTFRVRLPRDGTTTPTAWSDLTTR